MDQEIVPCNIEILINPEMGAAAIKRREDDLFLIWSILQSWSATYDNGSGRVKVNGLKKALYTYLGTNEIYAYEKIQQGIGKYWTAPGGKLGSRGLTLISSKRVIQYLQPDMLRCCPVKVPLRDLEPERDENNVALQSGKEMFRALLIAMIAARHRDGRPVTNQSIADCTGLSTRSVIRYKNIFGAGLQSRKNFLWIADAPTKEDAHKILADILNDIGRNNNRYFVLSAEDIGFIVAKQIGNAYWLSQYEIGALKQRNRTLHEFDVNNVQDAPLRKFCINPKHISANSTSSEKFICIGKASHITKSGKVMLWSAPIGG